MKLKYLSIAVCVLVVLASCAKKADVWERAATEQVKMLSFGFYKADNPDVLIRDFVISNVNSNNISVSLPADVDRSALIARFTTSDNDVIRVGSTPQKSGETANDFRAPVDYFLSEGNYNAKYTVNIIKGGDYIWAPVPFTIVDSAVSLKMKINPITGDPYVMFYESRTPTSDQKASMVAYENMQWVRKGVISDDRITSYYDFTFDRTGNPYAAYGDFSATTAQTYTVKKLDGGAWTLVGDKGFTPVKVSYNAIAFGPDDVLRVFPTMDAVGGGYVRREIAVGTFESGSWTLGKMPGRAGTLSTYNQVAKLKNGAIYVAMINAITPNSISVHKFSENTWTTIIDTYRDPAGTNINLSELGMDIDNEGNVYVAFQDNSSSAYKNRVIKYNASTQQISAVGGLINAAIGGSVDFDFALSPNGTPYVLYRNTSNYPEIVSFDNESQDWGTPHVFESQVADNLNVGFTATGEAYVAYLKGRKFFIHKYYTP